LTLAQRYDAEPCPKVVDFTAEPIRLKQSLTAQPSFFVNHHTVVEPTDSGFGRFQEAVARIGIRKLGTHSLRHSYRSWLDAVGTPVAVQQKLMRHAHIRTTFNIYGDVVTNEMAQAHSKVVRLALPKHCDLQ
jgi:integrase